MKFLAETALLTHGLASLTNEEIRQEWMEAFGGTPRGEEFRVRHDGREPHVVWLENGQIKTGGIDEYLRIRSDIKSDNLKNVLRVDARTLDEAVFQGKTAALTASATMEICWNGRHRRYQRRGTMSGSSRHFEFGSDSHIDGTERHA